MSIFSNISLPSVPSMAEISLRVPFMKSRGVTIDQRNLRDSLSAGRSFMATAMNTLPSERMKQLAEEEELNKMMAEESVKH